MGVEWRLASGGGDMESQLASAMMAALPLPQPATEFQITSSPSITESEAIAGHHNGHG